MTYPNIHPALFLARPNRFIAEIELNGRKEICHVKNTGRCRELLLPGTKIYVQQFEGGTRKTRFDLIAVHKGDRLINMDSQAPNRVFREWCPSFFPALTTVRPECRYGQSRLDFYLEAGERKIFAEVKGVTLEENGVALFPDAPTERGIRHLEELCSCAAEGYEAYAVFIIQMKDVRYFTPNIKTHAAFGEALARAAQKGVQVLALDCRVTPDSLSVRQQVPVYL